MQYIMNTKSRKWVTYALCIVAIFSISISVVYYQLGTNCQLLDGSNGIALASAACLLWINKPTTNLTKEALKHSGLFDSELIEEIAPDTVLYRPEIGDIEVVGVLCRSTGGIRFVVDGKIYLAIDNESIESVDCNDVSTLGVSNWKHLGLKALMFKRNAPFEGVNFFVPESVASSWKEHFDIY
jgi:hypothetical protein